jgi:uncharacterized lipoprotein YmbA
MQRLLICLALLALQGCVSSTLYTSYTLDMAPSATAGAGRLAVGRITLSDTLAAAAMPIRTGPTTLDYYSASQWAGSLEDLLREKFQTEFGGTVATGDMKVMDAHVLAFEQVDISATSAAAHAKIEVQVRTANSSRYAQPLFARVYDVTLPMERPGAEALAASLSRCVEQIAAQLQSDIAGL